MAKYSETKYTHEIFGISQTKPCIQFQSLVKIHLITTHGCNILGVKKRNNKPISRTLWFSGATIIVSPEVVMSKLALPVVLSQHLFVIRVKSFPFRRAYWGRLILGWMSREHCAGEVVSKSNLFGGLYHTNQYDVGSVNCKMIANDCNGVVFIKVLDFCNGWQREVMEELLLSL